MVSDVGGDDSDSEIVGLMNVGQSRAPGLRMVNHL